ncbi:hypothetical protein GCM10008090_29770 [Arenicella chitinivorans]|uniref:Uncharacterized protein n=1 Tax=Arenicella chitinivorans TaxID=1329800 RepID=A0A918VRN5_9GAMM|nr:hypothetical protein [Arenicella chitinivorans]GHA18240.1 hypothetical protein GCM10008090_29770 [Arenicella chitinivorans]
MSKQAPNAASSTLRTRRALFGLATTAALAPLWAKPVVNTIVLPAHAQTSVCVTDTTVGGPLAGAPDNPPNCQVACEAEAARENALLCEVRETPTDSGTDCACDIDVI